MTQPSCTATQETGLAARTTWRRRVTLLREDRPRNHGYGHDPEAAYKPSDRLVGWASAKHPEYQYLSLGELHHHRLQKASLYMVVDYPC